MRDCLGQKVTKEAKSRDKQRREEKEMELVEQEDIDQNSRKKKEIE